MKLEIKNIIAFVIATFLWPVIYLTIYNHWYLSVGFDLPQLSYVNVMGICWIKAMFNRRNDKIELYTYFIAKEKGIIKENPDYKIMYGSLVAGLISSAISYLLSIIIL